MVTSIGMFLRKLRIDKGEILKNMADTLGVSSAFLSAVENGKKKFPEAWHQKLADKYELSPEQKDELQQAIIESKDVIELNLQRATAGNRQLAISFARQFDSLDEKTSRQIFDILNKHKEE